MTSGQMKALKKIKVFAMDVDGVMTDGRIVYDGDGKELKFFDVQDGHGIACVRHAGLKTAVISARSSTAVKARTKDLKFDRVYLGAYPKISAYEKMLKVFGVSDEEVCFMAAPEIKKIVDHVTQSSGGRGAVREVAEMILKAQGLWRTA